MMVRRSLLPFVTAAFTGLLLLAQSEPWQASDVMQPEALAARLARSGARPMILYVGFPVLYRGTHIPGALLAGPVGKPEGLALMKEVVSKVGRDQEIVIYCGCCPFSQCPNIRPAFQTLRGMGYKNVKLVMMPTNLSKDWVMKGYPVEKAAGAPKM